MAGGPTTGRRWLAAFLMPGTSRPWHWAGQSPGGKDT